MLSRSLRNLFLCTFMVCTCASIVALAQPSYTLEQVDMSPADGIQEYNTYVLDINNRGYFCGYYTNSLKENVGYVVTRKGVHFDIDVSVTGSTDNKVVSINDRDVALVSSQSAGETTLWKVYMGDEQMSALVKVEGITMKTVNALKINNRNDISGWYQGQNSRWLFILHDSIVPPGKPAWQASRYMEGSTWYNTWGCGMDTNNVIAGFYNNSPNFYPFIYNANTDSYKKLIAPSKTKVWDMNNAQVLVGETQLSNGVYMAFVGEVQGSTLQTTSLEFIFHSKDIASVANGINDKRHVVGQFLDPNTKTWKGFIYRPGQERYGYKGFYEDGGYKHHTFSFENTESAEPGNQFAHWNKDFCDTYIDYNRYDTYLNDGKPLLDSEMKATFSLDSISNRSHLDWKSYCIEADNNFTLMGSMADKDYYKKILKKMYFEEWLTWIDTPEDSTEYFYGDCFGFTSLSLLHYVNPDLLHDWFNIPRNANLFSFTNMDSLSKRAIVRAQFRQHNDILHEKYFLTTSFRIPQWYGLYRTKTYMLDTLQKVNIRTIGVLGYEDGSLWGHAVFPHHIHTPKKLPFKNPVTLQMEADTIIIYDPNFADSPGEFIQVRSDKNALVNTGLYSPKNNLSIIHFDRPTYTELFSTPFTFPQKTSSQGHGHEIAAVTKQKRYRFSFSRKSDYTLRKAAEICSRNGKLYTNGIADLIDVKTSGVKAYLPLNFMIDTSASLAFSLSKYADLQMRVIQTIDNMSMSISRKAQLDQHDNGSLSKRTICYGNPENIAKTISCAFTQSKADANKAMHVSASSFVMAANDSLVTTSPRDYCYQITHPKKGSLSYDLNMYVLYPNEIKHYSQKKIALSPRSSHIIEPYSSGSSSSSVTIGIDSNLDGIVDDSTRVSESAVQVETESDDIAWLQCYPNPVSDNINLRVDLSHSGKYTIVICNLKGAIELRSIADMTTLGTSVQLNVASLAPGRYSLILLDTGQKVVATKSFLKE